MTLLLMMVITMFAAIIQSLLPSLPFLGSARAPVVLGVVMYYALTRERGLVLAAGLLAGIFEDALSSRMPMGCHSFLYVLVGLYINQYREKVFGNHWLTHMFLGVLACAAVTLGTYVLLMIRARPVDGAVSFAMPLGGMLVMGAGVILMGLAVIPITFKVVERLDYKLGNIELREI
ncbi:MAG: rod shape-determining protein MreD [Kiritimatiellia bacterium]|jgi:rod shape-determining protein MreD